MITKKCKFIISRVSIGLFSLLVSLISFYLLSTFKISNLILSILMEYILIVIVLVTMVFSAIMLGRINDAWEEVKKYW